MATSASADAIGLGVTVALVNAFSNEAKAIANDMRKLEKEVTGGTARVDAGLSNLSRGFKVFAAGIAGLLVFDAATDKAVAFSKNIAEIATVSDEATFSAAKTRDTLMGLNAQFGGGLETQAKGLYQTISAGITDAAEATDLLTQANLLAVGGDTDTFTAVDGLTTSVNAFAAQGLKARDATDAMFIAILAGKTTAEEFSKSLGTVAPTAASLGVSFDDLSAAVATATLSGIQTSEAMTGLKAAFANVIRPARDARLEAARLGIDFSAGALRAKGLAGFISEITNNSKFNADSLGRLFHSVEALNVVQSLTANGSSKFNDILGQMTGKAGATQRAFDKMNMTVAQQEKRFAALRENAITRIGEALEPLRARVISFGSSIVEVFLALPEPVRNFFVRLAYGAAVLTAVVGAVVALRGAVQLLPFALRLVGLSFSSSFAPVLPLMLGIAAAAGIFYAAWRSNFGGIRDVLTRWYESARLVIEGVWELFGSSEKGVGSIPVALQETLLRRGLWPIVQSIFVWGERVRDLFGGLVEGVRIAFGVTRAIVEPVVQVFVIVASAVARVIARLLSLEGGANRLAGGTQAMSDRFHALGVVLGIVGAYLVITKAATLAHQAVGVGITAVTWAWQTAQWALNVALTLNPIGLVILGIVALIAVVATAILYWDRMTLAVQRSYVSLLKVGNAIGSVSDWDLFKGKIDLATQEIQLSTRVAQGRDSFGARLSEALGVSEPGASVAPPAGTPTAAERQAGLTAPIEALAAGAAGGSGSGGVKTFVANLNLSGKQIHQVVLDEEGNAQDRDYGGGG